MMWFTNVIPQGMKIAGDAFKRRPLVHDVELVFVDDTEYHGYEGKRPHFLRLADNTARANMCTFVDELGFLMHIFELHSEVVQKEEQLA